MPTRPDALARLLTFALILARLLSRLDVDDDARRALLASVADRLAEDTETSDLEALRRLVTLDGLLLREEAASPRLSGRRFVGRRQGRGIRELRVGRQRIDGDHLR